MASGAYSVARFEEKARREVRGGALWRELCLLVSTIEHDEANMIQHILVSTDFSEASDRALATAVELAQALRARVTLLHVVVLPIVNIPDLTYVPSAEEANEILESDRRRVDAEARRYSTSNIEISTELRTGNIVEVTIAFARERGCDLLVVGSHGRSAFGAAILGSPARDLLRASPIPVLTVHGSRDEAVAA